MGITRQLVVNNWLHFDLWNCGRRIFKHNYCIQHCLKFGPDNCLSSYVSLQSIKMTIFLVDLEFREKIKHYLRPKEILFVVFFLFFALIPWVDVFNFVYTNMGGNATKFWEDLDVEVHCNPKFGKLCHQP